ESSCVMRLIGPTAASEVPSMILVDIPNRSAMARSPEPQTFKRSMFEFENCTAADLAGRECVGRFVDVVDSIALGAERIEIEFPVLVPVEEHREVAVRLARAADAADEALFVEQHVHCIQFDRRTRHADQYRGAAGVNAEPTRA